MTRLLRLSRTTLGKKLWMVLSGLVLLGFLVGHLAGNLKVLQGPDALNEYAAWLKGHPFLWVFRAVLLAAFAAHVGLGVALARENRSARPLPYARDVRVRAGAIERHMVLSGLLVLAFLAYHLGHLTFGVLDPAGAASLVDAGGRPDVYARVVAGFREPWLAGTYLVALLVLGVHLQHAIRSGLQTLGVSHESYQGLVEGCARVLPALLVASFAVVPVLVLLGVIGSGEGSAR